MKILRSVLIALILLFLSSAGIMAAQPTAALGPNGTTIDLSGQTVTQINTSSNTGLNAGWYWAGGDTSGTPVNVTEALSFASGAKGDVNIVVGPNGTEDKPAMLISGALKIPSGVIVNIYQAANYGSGGQEGTPALDNCFLQINGGTTSSAARNGTEAPAPGIVVQNGGQLNVISGAIEGFAGSKDKNSASKYTTVSESQPGISVEAGGSITVSGGELQGNGIPQYSSGTASNPVGIIIASSSGGIKAGSLTVSGGLLFSNSDGQTVGAPINGPVTYSGGTVWSATEPTTGNGVWINTGTNSTRNISAFGTGGTFTCGVYTMIPCNGTFNVPSGATVDMNDTGVVVYNGGKMTIDGIVNVNTSNGLWFDVQPEGVTLSTNTGGSSLTIGNTATLNISPTGNVTLGAQSTLNNSGTINVEETTPAQ